MRQNWLVWVKDFLTCEDKHWNAREKDCWVIIAVLSECIGFVQQVGIVYLAKYIC